MRGCAVPRGRPRPPILHLVVAKSNVARGHTSYSFLAPAYPEMDGTEKEKNREEEEEIGQNESWENTNEEMTLPWDDSSIEAKCR